MVGNVKAFQEPRARCLDRRPISKFHQGQKPQWFHRSPDVWLQSGPECPSQKDRLAKRERPCMERSQLAAGQPSRRLRRARLPKAPTPAYCRAQGRGCRRAYVRSRLAPPIKLGMDLTQQQLRVVLDRDAGLNPWAVRSAARAAIAPSRRFPSGPRARARAATR